LAKIYADLIRKGRKTLDQVPAIIRKDVESILEAMEIIGGDAIPEAEAGE